MRKPRPIPWAGIGSVLTAGALVLSGCSSSSHTSITRKSTVTNGERAPFVGLPPPTGKFSYQIGGAYPLPSGVDIVDRDHSERPATGVYSICYVNAFQAQTEEVGWWKQHHPQLLLRQTSGALVIDKDWNEPLFDISTPAKRAALLSVVGGWIDGCAASGYRAVEADNLDSYTRSDGLLTRAEALAFAKLLITRAHHDHLAIAQKNAADLSSVAHKAGFDFAVAEECQAFNECDAYTSVYGREVIEIEYTYDAKSVFTTACKLRGKTISVVLRDRDVAPAGAPGYVERWC